MCSILWHMCNWTGTGKRYLRVYIHLRFRHARSRAQPLAWPVTLSVAGVQLECQEDLCMPTYLESISKPDLPKLHFFVPSYMHC